jgi:hypothetical protein
MHEVTTLRAKKTVTDQERPGPCLLERPGSLRDGKHVTCDVLRVDGMDRMDETDKVFT